MRYDTFVSAACCPALTREFAFMSIRFAAASRSASPVLARILTRLVPPEPANDTGADSDGELGGRDQLLRLALRHFSDYGLAAASVARDKARAAFHAHAAEDYQMWLAICRTLDRRMADATQRHLGQRGYAPSPFGQTRPAQRRPTLVRLSPRSF